MKIFAILATLVAATSAYYLVELPQRPSLPGAPQPGEFWLILIRKKRFFLTLKFLGMPELVRPLPPTPIQPLPEVPPMVLPEIIIPGKFFVKKILI